ncbi:hypothetical protein DMB65_02125 [Flavobacterium cheongpyeongense]|uniref:Uncharacterized protein n=1 Tax=Flavobacterium cheongpyeongense TaxID=2212651 RepID=A0A2V4BUY5_9FLAO|nr:hypothetical protein [Flavobacterium cheongpyeongense]PXY42836.1 hypothetical protein DMB65_02125 [Flavobacterium cheongpyeongense]
MNSSSPAQKLKIEKTLNPDGIGCYIELFRNGTPRSIVVNPDFYEEYNGKMGIGNSDYYSATAVLKHEHKHFKGLGADPWTDHLQVWIQTFKEIVKDGTYSKLGKDHKDYIYKVGVGYIDDMKWSLSNKGGVKSEDFDYAYDLLNKTHWRSFVWVLWCSIASSTYLN